MADAFTIIAFTLALLIVAICGYGAVYVQAQKTAIDYKISQSLGLLPPDDEMCGRAVK